MPNDPNHVHVYVDPNEMADPEAFHEDWRTVRTEFGPDEQPEAFDSALRSAQMRDGETTALDTVLAGAMAARSGEKQEPVDGGYRVTVDPATAAIKGILKTRVIAEDSNATAAASRMADKIGYGPKTNASSFKTSGVGARH